MQFNNMIVRAYSLWQELRRTGSDGISMRVRLFAFFASFLFAIVMGFMLILMLTGTFDSGAKESRLWMENELTHLTRNVSNNYGKLSVQGISLAQTLSANLENQMSRQEISASELQKHPEILEPLLDSQMDYLISSLKVARSSGIFLILDATVNPLLDDSQYSKAGVFLKSIEPNIVNAADVNIRYLRGPSDCARNRNLELLPQWKMEFNIKDNSFYTTMLNTSKTRDLPLSRLYYWSPRITLPGNSESSMLLCVPLISSEGTVFGVCGFEVSSMLFKLAYSPDNSIYFRVFTTLAPTAGGYVDVNSGLIAGNYYLTSYLAGENVNIHSSDHEFNTYYAADDKVYRGLHRNISLYPYDSAFVKDEWLLAVMIPEKDIKDAIADNNRILFIAFTALLAFSLVLAVFISKRYIDPIVSALNLIKTNNHSTIPKTKFIEINDLLEFLAAQDESQEERRHSDSMINPLSSSQSENASNVNLSFFDEFVRNIETLSTAERAVFNLYMEGYTAKEITEILYLSINTIKTHNKRIYMKLNVSSRKELMVYVQMMNQRISKNDSETTS